MINQPITSNAQQKVRIFGPFFVTVGIFSDDIRIVAVGLWFCQFLLT